MATRSAGRRTQRLGPKSREAMLHILASIYKCGHHPTIFIDRTYVTLAQRLDGNGKCNIGLDLGRVLHRLGEDQKRQDTTEKGLMR